MAVYDEDDNLVPLPPEAPGLYSFETMLKVDIRALRASYKKFGRDFFYESTDDGPKFNPALLVVYLRRIYPCVTMRDNGEIYFYNKDTGNYISGGKTYLEEIIEKILTDKYYRNRAETVIDHIKVSTYRDRADFKLPLNMIPVRNGIIKIPITDEGAWNFKETELIPNSPDHFVVNRIPVIYNPKASCPRWVKFLREVLDPGNVDFIQEYIGYCLYRDFAYHKVVMLQGPTRTGKSTLLFVLGAFLGDDNTVSIALQDLKDKFQRVRLNHKLANILADIGTKELKDSSIFKQLSGGDRISAERKYQMAFEFLSFAKYLWSCNTMPYVYDDTDAFYERWKLIRVNKKQYFGDADPQLKYTLIEELPGILNWALAGLKRLLEQRTFSNCEHWSVTKQLWNMLSDPLASFMESEWTAFKSTASTTKEAFNDHFIAFCKHQNLSAISKEKLGREIKKRYGENGIITETYEGSQGQQKRSWKGIEIIDPDRSEDYADQAYEMSRDEGPATIEEAFRSHLNEEGGI